MTLPKTYRIGFVEFYLDEIDPVYGKRNIGIQLSLMCIAIMLWRWSAGIMWVREGE